MVTDGILSAVQGMTDRFDTVEGKNAGKAIFEMLADFDRKFLSAQTLCRWNRPGQAVPFTGYRIAQTAYHKPYLINNPIV